MDTGSAGFSSSLSFVRLNALKCMKTPLKMAADGSRVAADLTQKSGEIDMAGSASDCRWRGGGVGISLSRVDFGLYSQLSQNPGPP